MRNPKVSVLLPVFNGAPFIGEAIESVLSQTYQDFELIVIDDGSTDGTADIVKSFDRLIYQRQANRGRAAARNAGLMTAQGNYIAFLDADDVWKRDRLEREVQFLDTHPEIDLVHGEIEAINRGGKTDEVHSGRFKKIYGKERKMGSGYLRLLDECGIFSSTILFRKDCVSHIGFYDESLPIYEDYDWYLRFAFHYSIALLPPPAVALYRVHESNSFARFSNEKIAKIYLGILDKQLAQIDGSPLKHRLKGPLLKKTIEFHWRLHDKALIRTKVLEIARLNPKLFLDWRLIGRFLFSL